jgi:2,4-dienoyl-CoA reductase (NADPH2)
VTRWKTDFSSLEGLAASCRDVGADIALSQDLSVLQEPLEVVGRCMPNALAIHPMEGCDGERDGSPGALTIRRYQRFAAGGAALLWFEAVAVCPEGRANPRQLWINRGNVERFAELIKDMRRRASDSMGAGHRPLIIAQLTHSGRYSRPGAHKAPFIAQRDPYRDPLLPEPQPSGDRPAKLGDSFQIVSDDYLDRLQDQYIDAARLALAAGFDGVDIKACHGYLIGELLAAREREGRYGGSFENRARFILEVADRIADDLGRDCLLASRLGCYDAVPWPYGWGVDAEDYRRPDLSEPKRLIALLAERGLRLIDFTAANPYYNPHIGRPFDSPVENGYEEPEHPLKGVARLLELAAELQRSFPDTAFVGTGYSYLRQYLANAGAATLRAGGAKLVGGGRMAFAYPDFARDIIVKGGMDTRKVCIACSRCTQLMRDGQPTGCPVRDRAVYHPLYEQGRAAARGKTLQTERDDAGV